MTLNLSPRTPPNYEPRFFDDVFRRIFAALGRPAAATQTAEEILDALLTVDGAGSGLDADTLDGQSSAAFAAASHTHPLAQITDEGALAALNTVGSAQIDNDAVTYAKMQNVSGSDKLLGRISGAGDPEEITCTAAGRNLLDDASAADQRTTLGAAASSHTHALADITDEGALAALNTVGTAQIDNGAVTLAKIVDASAQGMIVGRKSSGSGDWEECTINELLDLQSLPWRVPKLYVTSSDQTLIGTAFTDITGLGQAVEANEIWMFEAEIIADASATTTGIDITFNGPGSPANVQMISWFWISLTALQVRPQSAFDENEASGDSAGTQRAIYSCRGIFTNGANAGTLIPRIKREAAGTGPNVRTGSVAKYWRLA